MKIRNSLTKDVFRRRSASFQYPADLSGSESLRSGSDDERVGEFSFYVAQGSAQSGQLSQDMSTGLSLLLARPQLLLANLHHLVLALAYRIYGSDQPDMYASTAFNEAFSSDLLSNDVEVNNELVGQLALNQEIMDKVRGMEGKLEYQIKKLLALSEASVRKGAELEPPEEGLSVYR